MKASGTRRTRLGRLLVLYRASENIGVRELAAQLGLSSATVSRLERGHAIDADTLIKIWVWLTAPAPAADADDLIDVTTHEDAARVYIPALRVPK